MPKEHISGSPIETREIPCILWPTHPLPAELLTEIVNRSRSRSLREIIANVLRLEANDMWEHYKKQFAPPPRDRHDQDIAIKEGYTGVAKDLLHACRYFNDRQGAVGFDISSLKTAERILSLEPNKAIEESLPRVMEWRMRDAVESLTIDPSGIDWLTRELNINEGAWNSKYSRTTKYGGDDPEVFGYRKGLARYKSLYRQAVEAGATPDRGSNITRRVSLKIKRRVAKIFRT